MAEGYIGEIRLFAGDYAPAGWAFCAGQTLQVRSNQALYALLGNTFGGNAPTTFCLPDLRGRIPIGTGAGPGLTPRTLGGSDGAETVTIAATTLGPHGHDLVASSAAGTSASPDGAALAVSADAGLYLDPAASPGAVAATLSPFHVQPAPDAPAAAHDNMMPSLGLTYIIAMTGSYPPRDSDAEEDDEALIGEVRPWAFKNVPSGWLLCQGQSLSPNVYQALFSVIGVVYGGDGKTSFLLPNLLGRVALDAGAGPGLTPRQLGQMVGEASVTLTADQIPPHTHGLVGYCTDNADAAMVAPTATSYLAGGAASTYTLGAPTHGGTLSTAAAGPSGGGQPHDNLQPYLAVNYAICLMGIYPVRP